MAIIFVLYTIKNLVNILHKDIFSFNLMTKKIVIIGGGISGIIAAANLKYKKPEYEIILLEKNNVLGGRLYQSFLNNNVINNGPSWLWFKDLIENTLNEIGFDARILETIDLDPQYKIIYNKNSFFDVNKTIINDLKNIDKNIENNINNFIERNQHKYDLCINTYLKYDNISVSEYFNIHSIKNIFKLDIFDNYKNIINKISKNLLINKILLWPSLFIGSNPDNISGLFSILTYYMLKNGTQIYSNNGMIDIVHKLEEYLTNIGVKVHKNSNVENYIMNENKIIGVKLNNSDILYCDDIISSIDYQYSESLLENKYRSYPKLYWDKQIMCPSSLVINIVLNRKLDNLEYHNLFFNHDLQTHIKDIYNDKHIPENPLFYLNITSKIFHNECVNKEHENLFILIPTSNYTNMNEYDIKYLYFNIISQITSFVGFDIEPHIIKTKFTKDVHFNTRFNAFKNNAYGLSCENYQFGFCRPKIKSRYVSNLYYCGQTSCPGPGIPPSIISGLNTSNLLIKTHNEDIKNSKSGYISSFFTEFWIIITNLIVNIITFGFNLIGLKTTFACFLKEVNYIIFNKLKPNNYFRYE
jgi:phytoene desaturase